MIYEKIQGWFNLVQRIMKKKILVSLMFIVMLWIVVTNVIMTFRNPQMTQTQLFLHIPKTVILNFDK